VYGLGTGLPVVVFSLLIAAGTNKLGRAFNAMSTIDRAARPVTGVIFILAGLYLAATHLFGLNLS
jgi:cytochrome c biogenesis protein CcdA